MTRGLLSVFAVFIFCCFGCKKEANKSPANGEYLPLTDGFTWKYDYASDGGSTDTLIVKMTGGTTVINSKTYYNAASTYKQGTSLGYFYAGNHTYATRTTDNGAGSIELQLLNDTASVGYTWVASPTDNGMVGAYPAQTVNTIKEKNITRTLNGITFTNVIHTQVQLQYNFGAGFETTITYDFYLAKGIGLIENDANTLNTLYETETLFDYTVK
jgi:hypothetical protein